MANVPSRKADRCREQWRIRGFELHEQRHDAEGLRRGLRYWREARSAIVETEK
jgi:hypothetical protein